MLLCSWDFPGKNTGVGCHFLPQEIFLILCLLLGSWILYHWATWEAPVYTQGSLNVEDRAEDHQSDIGWCDVESTSLHQKQQQLTITAFESGKWLGTKKASTWKRQGNGSQEGIQCCQQLDFSQVRFISDFWSQELKDNKVVLFSAINFGVICYSSNGKLIHTWKYLANNFKWR